MEEEGEEKICREKEEKEKRDEIVVKIQENGGKGETKEYKEGEEGKRREEERWLEEGEEGLRRRLLSGERNLPWTSTK